MVELFQYIGEKKRRYTVSGLTWKDNFLTQWCFQQKDKDNEDRKERAFGSEVLSYTVSTA